MNNQLIILIMAGAAAYLITKSKKAGATSTGNSAAVTPASGPISNTPSRWDLITSNPAAYTSAVDNYGINGF